MTAFRLGQIETFPFINPPAPAAIQGGYALLQELRALDEARQLTPLGHGLARLPIDPTLGRMLLQSQRERATRELLIIAAGLSIQDPRERPRAKRSGALGPDTVLFPCRPIPIPNRDLLWPGYPGTGGQGWIAARLEPRFQRYGSSSDGYPGLRCAAPWAVMRDAVGVPNAPEGTCQRRPSGLTRYTQKNI